MAAEKNRKEEKQYKIVKKREEKLEYLKRWVNGYFNSFIFMKISIYL